MTDVIYDRKNSKYYIKEKIEDQTFLMEFQEDFHLPTNTLYYNVWLTITNKRKHWQRNEDLKLSTGKYAFISAKWTINAFDELEKRVIEENINDYNIVIYCWWTDNRRRDVYYKVLSRKGYTYQYIRPDACNKKVIAKRWKQNTNV